MLLFTIAQPLYNILLLYFENIMFFGYVVSECYTGIGDAYNGKRAKTRSGIPCALWKDHSER